MDVKTLAEKIKSLSLRIWPDPNPEIEALLTEFREESKSEVGREVKFLKYGEDSPRVKKAVAQEREECAKVVEEKFWDSKAQDGKAEEWLAAQIRRRGEGK